MEPSCVAFQSSERKRKFGKLDNEDEKRIQCSSWRVDDSSCTPELNLDSFYHQKNENGITVTYGTAILEKLHDEFESFLKNITNNHDAQDANSCDDSTIPAATSCETSELSANQDSEALSEGEISDGDTKDYACAMKEYNVDSFGAESDASSFETKLSKHEECLKNDQRESLHDKLPHNDLEKYTRKSNCQCDSRSKEKWVVHGIFRGEKFKSQCNFKSNNASKLWHYRIDINPSTNFQLKMPTCIQHNGLKYEFKGFSLFSHYSLSEFPKCSFIRYHQEYTVKLVPEEFPQIFCLRDLELFQKYILEGLLEVKDWQTTEKDECKNFHFMPRFVRQRELSLFREHQKLLDDPSSYERLDEISKRDSKRRHESEHNQYDQDNEEHNLLPMNYVLDYLIKMSKPLIEPHQIQWTREHWRNYERTFYDSLVFFPCKKPACIRVDGILPAKEPIAKRQKSDEAYPRVRHVTLTTSSNRSNYLETVKVSLPTKGGLKTGVKSDVTQHFLIVYLLTNHLRYHKSLELLEENICYKFQDRLLLQRALKHPSSCPYETSPLSGHLEVAAMNCGIYSPKYGEWDVHRSNRRKGINLLSKSMAKLAESEEHSSNLKDNEALEFLGDAVLEFVTSSHLFFMLEDFSEGSLDTFRSALVQNRNLADIAKRLGLEHFLHFGHRFWRATTAAFDHILANCVEALLGAVYLDGGFDKAEKLACDFLFTEEDLKEVWRNVPKHFLQRRAPNGDRHMIPKSEILQKLVSFEEQIGIVFNHICLLAKAFTHRNAKLNNITCGNNQRLEFFGDSILKFIISDYLFRHFPEHQEGHLTLLRSSLVNAKCQATISRQLGLDSFINFGNEKAISGIKPKALADAFEAFIAAVFIDQGIEFCKKICEVCLVPKLETFIVSQEWIDSKSRLQHCCLAIKDDNNRKENPVYRQLEAVGPSSCRTFRVEFIRTVGVYFKGKRIGTGNGKSIQAAEMAAAEDALESNYFEVMEKQKRLLDRQHKEKRKQATPLVTYENPSATGMQDSDPEWVYDIAES